MNDYVSISFYLFPFASKVGPYDNMAPPSRAKGGAMAPVAPPAAASVLERKNEWTKKCTDGKIEMQCEKPPDEKMRGKVARRKYRIKNSLDENRA